MYVKVCSPFMPSLSVTALLTTCLLLKVSLGAVVQQPLNNDDHSRRLDSALIELEAALPKALDDAPRIQDNHPVAKPCYSRDERGTIVKNPALCNVTTSNRTNDAFMTDQPGSYYFGNWGSCQREGKACAIPASQSGKDPSNLQGGYISNLSTCYQGSVPDYFINIQSVEDLQVIFNHSAKLQQPIVIKNTGHDWKGRSASPGTIALWTHNLRSPNINITMLQNFVPIGDCSFTRLNDKVMHFGAGEQFRQLYSFADKHNRAVMGGTCPTVGIAGWLHGGGHSPLTPHYGMGVDNVRQLRIVTPKGEDLIINSCQYPDLFKAVKGGGGGTFGVIVEVWYATLPKERVQEFTLSLWGLDPYLVREFITILVDNANDWASKGWGGYINTIRQDRSVTIINPRQSPDAAKADMQPLIDFAKRLGAPYIAKERDSWYDYFHDSFGDPDYHKSTWGAAVASRLIPRSLFDDESDRTELINILVELHFSRVNFIIMPVTPSAFDFTKAQPSVLHPTWHNATWLVRINDRWDSFYEVSTPSTNHKAFERVHHAMNRIRKLTPNMGVSINEADIWEPRHEESFWGAENYEHLRQVKQQHDPNNVLKVFQGVGARDWEHRFRCYPRQEDL